VFGSVDSTWNHWAYKKTAETPSLEQGDLLKRTPELIALLELYHPHYAKHPENRFYTVLTQSCDLVRRKNEPCNARYIAIAPVRPLHTIVNQEFSDRIRTLDDGSTIAGKSVETDVSRFLARLFNNNESAFFYFEAEPSAGITSSMCAVLALPISFKKEHYESLLAAKVIGIDDSFQAKLGWLIGKLYSRVGTRDFSEEDMHAKVKGLTDSLALWLDQRQFKALQKLLTDFQTANPGTRLTSDVVETLLPKIPNRKAIAVDAVLAAAASVNLAPDPSDDRKKFKAAIEQSKAFSDLFK